MFSILESKLELICIILNLYTLFSSKEDMEMEDGDSIEKVMWHQPKTMTEKTLTKSLPKTS